MTLIRSSTYDGNHRYTIEIKKNDKEARIISVDPTTKKMVVIYISGKETLPNLGMLLGVPIDLIVAHDTSAQKSVTSEFSDLMFDLHSNAYDMVRLLTITKTIPSGDITNLTFRYPISEADIDSKTNGLFTDSGFTDDNKTVAIINASDTSGLGSRFERVIEKSGGTVLAVTSAPNSSTTSSLTYTGDKTYTVWKLEKTLHVVGVSRDTKGLSDISVVLGTDQNKEVVK